jgi:hypothetical protein
MARRRRVFRAPDEILLHGARRRREIWGASDIFPGLESPAVCLIGGGIYLDDSRAGLVDS